MMAVMVLWSPLTRQLSLLLPSMGTYQEGGHLFTGEHSKKLHSKNKLSQRPDILGALKGAKTDVSTEKQRMIQHSAHVENIHPHCTE